MADNSVRDVGLLLLLFDLEVSSGRIPFVRRGKHLRVDIIVHDTSGVAATKLCCRGPPEYPDEVDDAADCSQLS